MTVRPKVIFARHINPKNTSTVSEDPISERLSPNSKTARVGTNTRHLITFLDNQGLLSNSETHELLRQCILMDEDLRRCQRIKWVMTQQEIFFQPKLGGRARKTEFIGPEVKRNIYEVSEVGQGFILAHTCGEGGE